MSWSPATPEDLAFITDQMGHAPVGLVGIAARCACGHPAVAASYPIRREAGGPRPFPTLYWLTCPTLHRRLSQLEMGGAIAKLEAELAADPGLRERLAGDHERYAADRWDTLTEADRDAALHDPALAPLRERGIGGMRDRASVKCLHLHYAHHLVDGNAVGEMIERRFGVPSCPA